MTLDPMLADRVRAALLVYTRSTPHDVVVRGDGSVAVTYTLEQAQDLIRGARGWHDTRNDLLEQAGRMSTVRLPNALQDVDEDAYTAGTPDTPAPAPAPPLPTHAPPMRLRSELMDALLYYAQHPLGEPTDPALAGVLGNTHVTAEVLLDIRHLLSVQNDLLANLTTKVNGLGAARLLGAL